MNETFLKAKQLMESSQKILLTMHERMDGDDGGAGLAMAMKLRSLGKDIVHAIKQGVPGHLSFLPHSQHILDDLPDQEQNFDLLVTFGCASLSRTGSEKISTLNIPVINFDHHQDNTFFGDINVVDKDKSSVAELIYDFFIHAGWEITQPIATCLLTGIMSDTGSFRHSNTQTSTLQAAANLLKKGALVGKISKHTWQNKNPLILKAWGTAIDNARFNKDLGLMYSVLTEEDLTSLGPLPAGAFEGLVETLNTVPEAKFSLFVRQEGDKIKGSLRSDENKNIDVSKIAQRFGGGGHKSASGFAIPGKITRDENGNFSIH